MPEEDRERRAARSSSEQAAAEASPRTCSEKIAEGRLRKWLEEVVLLNQEHVNADKHERQDDRGAARRRSPPKTGENVVIRRFARFQVGEE